MYLLENGFLSLAVNAQGAELQSLVFKQREYLWQGDQTFWGRRSPILFPIVGKLREGKYFYGEKEYTLGQHGFARDLPFTMIKHQENEIIFELQDNEKTRNIYPFPFTLQISYEIEGASVIVRWQVENRGNTEMLYSIGAHPAFNIPFTTKHQPDETLVDIQGNEVRQLHFRDGFLDPRLHSAKRNFPLAEANFAAVDTLIYHFPRGGEAIIYDPQRRHGVKVSFDHHFPYFGIWSPQDGAPFVCLEPWAGVLDCFDHDGQLENKLGINRLAPAASEIFSYRIELF